MFAASAADQNSWAEVGQQAEDAATLDWWQQVASLARMPLL